VKVAGKTAPPIRRPTTRNSQPRSIPVAFQIHGKGAMASPKTQIMMCDILMISSGAACGRKYILYTSKVKIEETAMSSNEDDDITAIKSVRRSAIAPGFPKRATAAKGAESLEETWEEVMLLG
jgi:hypothetical protein